MAFYFCHNAYVSDQPVELTKEVVGAVINVVKLDVVATICNMDSNSVKALKEIGSTLSQPYFLCEEKKILTMYDPPPLLKCTTTLFQKYDVNLPVSVDEK